MKKSDIITQLIFFLIYITWVYLLRNSEFSGLSIFVATTGMMSGFAHAIIDAVKELVEKRGGE